MSNTFKLCLKHFSAGKKNFKPPLVTGLYPTGDVINVFAPVKIWPWLRPS